MMSWLTSPEWANVVEALLHTKGTAATPTAAGVKATVAMKTEHDEHIH